MAGKRFVKIAYTGRVKDGEVFDSTSEEIAKKEGIYSEKKYYSPMTVIVGEGQVLEGLDDALSEMEKGEEREIVIPPEKAYGPRSPDHVRLVSLGEFRKKTSTPCPGCPSSWMVGVRGYRLFQEAGSGWTSTTSWRGKPLSSTLK